MTPSTRLIPLVAALAALLLSSCAAEEDPVPLFEEPPATPTASVEAAPEKETLRQFVERWAEEERDMQNSGETAAYRQITAGCEPCESLANDMEEVYANGGFVQTDGMAIKKVQRLDQGLTKVWASVAPTTYSETSSGPEGSFPGGQTIYLATVKRSSGQWNLSTLVLVAE